MGYMVGYSRRPKAIFYLLKGGCKDKKDWARDSPQHAPCSQPRHDEKNLKYDRVYIGVIIGILENELESTT